MSGLLVALRLAGTTIVLSFTLMLVVYARYDAANAKPHSEIGVVLLALVALTAIWVR
jgi:hypothetical protein